MRENQQSCERSICPVFKVLEPTSQTVANCTDPDQIELWRRDAAAVIAKNFEQGIPEIYDGPFQEIIDACAAQIAAIQHPFSTPHPGGASLQERMLATLNQPDVEPWYHSL